jgi:hypothetical protein
MNRITEYHWDIHVSARPNLNGMRLPLQRNGSDRADSHAARRECADPHTMSHQSKPRQRRSWLARGLRIQWKRFVRWLLEPVPFPKWTP